jgi:hypothetical protein
VHTFRVKVVLGVVAAVLVGCNSSMTASSCEAGGCQVDATTMIDVDASSCDGHAGCGPDAPPDAGTPEQDGGAACQTSDGCPASGLCLPDGHCAAVDDVAYVDPMLAGDGDLTCSRPSPCAHLTTALHTSRRYVKLGIGVITDAAVVPNGRKVEIFGEPSSVFELRTQLTSPPGSAALTAQGVDTSVIIHHLAISAGDPGPGNPAVPNAINVQEAQLLLEYVVVEGAKGLGLFVDRGRITVVRSVIRNNQAGGLVAQDAGFELVGNIFEANGSPTSAQGAVRITVSEDTERTALSALDNHFELNTFHANRTRAQTGAALRCVVQGFTARGNLYLDNGVIPAVGETPDPKRQIEGSCSHEDTSTWPTTLLSGAGNQAVDPQLENPGTDFHPKPGSPIIGAVSGLPLSRFADVDINGVARPARPAIGACEPRPSQ